MNAAKFSELGVGVIRACPGTLTSSTLIRVNDRQNGAVRAGHHQESATNDDENTPANHQHPLRSSLFLSTAPVVVEPHGAHRLESHDATEQGTHQRHQTIEDGYATCNEVRDQIHTEGATEPGRPVDKGVASKVLRSSKNANKNELGGHLRDG